MADGGAYVAGADYLTICLSRAGLRASVNFLNILVGNGTPSTPVPELTFLTFSDLVSGG